MTEIQMQTEKMLAELFDRLWTLEKRVYRLEHPKDNIVQEASDAH